MGYTKFCLLPFGQVRLLLLNVGHVLCLISACLSILIFLFPMKSNISSVLFPKPVIVMVPSLYLLYLVVLSALHQAG